MNKLFLDIETTGLDINTTAVIEVGYLVVDDNNQVLSERHYTIIPEDIFIDYEWTEGAENVHRISEDDAFNHEYTHKTFCQQFCKDIETDFGNEGVPTIYGFNVGFDYWMLKRMFDKHEIRMPIHYSLGDISSMARVLLGDDYCSSRAMAPVLEVTVDEDKAHRAIYDCYLALECYKGLKEISPADNFTKMAHVKQSYQQLIEKDDLCKEELYEFMCKFMESL